MEIRFTRHAEEKFGILEEHQFSVSKKQVLEVLNTPDSIDHSRSPLIIAQGDRDAHHVLRVVYRREGADIIVITFYPGRKSQYEKK